MTTTSTDDDAQRRFVVGIDLGTTNCVLAWVDTLDESRTIHVMDVPQWVDVDVIQRQKTLPSFALQIDDALSQKPVDADDAWDQAGCEHGIRVGEFARRAGGSRPGRLISSAKSWLSHEGVDRSADLLPWHADAGVTRRSPAWASAAYLRHLRMCWDQSHPDDSLADQDVVITLPASFDEVARELTIQAAKMAGLPRVSLIEEPQAAFYAWIDRHRDDWSSRVRAGQLILVCDIGGGTTDLTLIRVRTAGDDAQDNAVQFHRVAVGKHLILGGDNLDLAVAKAAEVQSGTSLSPTQWQRLVAASRDVKETMLKADRPTQTTIHLPGEGSSLIGGGLDVTVTADQIDDVLLGGFFPPVPLNANVQSRQSGFQEMGLPYAADPAVTRHLAEFLHTHRRTGLDDSDVDSDRVEMVLFNGGVLASPRIRDRIVGCLSQWFGDSGDWQPAILESSELDLAVARGAAAYGLVRRGEGVRIASNLARTYFMQISQSPPRAVCVMPADAQPGQTIRLDSQPMQLQIGMPVVLPLWVSSTRLADRPGDIIAIEPTEMTPLPPIQTVLQDRKRKEQKTIDVVLESSLSEIGTIGLYCVDVDQANKRWKLEFDIRGTLQTDIDLHSGGGESAGIVDEETVQACRGLIADVFADPASKSKPQVKPSKLIAGLQTEIGQSRDAWSPVLLRQLWESTLAHESGRRRSPVHESRWLNLLGFALRPGYGVAVDDWRTAQTWRTVQGKIVHADGQVRAETWVLWRRIAGGLTAGQQNQLAATLGKVLLKSPATAGKSVSQDLIEAWRLAGALERIGVDEKQTFVRHATQTLRRGVAPPLASALLWAIGRIGSRVPVYGPLNLTIAASPVQRIVHDLVGSIGSSDDGEVVRAAGLAVTLLTRRCDDRFRDVDEPTRAAAAHWLTETNQPHHFQKMVLSGGTWDHDEQTAVLGDTLPLGITLRG